MSVKRFPSKVDRWIVAVFVLAMLAQLAAVVFVLTQHNDPWGAVAITAATLVVFFFVAAMFRFTYYAVEGDVLRIVCGPFRWRVPISQISSVEATRNPLSSPALSLDRLRIQYGDGKKILVSPADKAGFLKAIGQDAA
jgi:membrane protein YdbS with pleckstrin-like domain